MKFEELEFFCNDDDVGAEAIRTPLDISTGISTSELWPGSLVLTNLVGTPKWFLTVGSSLRGVSVPIGVTFSGLLTAGKLSGASSSCCATLSVLCCFSFGERAGANTPETFRGSGL